jgi:hypothetical protein
MKLINDTCTYLLHVDHMICILTSSFYIHVYRYNEAVQLISTHKTGRKAIVREVQMISRQEVKVFTQKVKDMEMDLQLLNLLLIYQEH